MGRFYRLQVGRDLLHIYVSDVSDGNLAFHAGKPVFANSASSSADQEEAFKHTVEGNRKNLSDRLQALSLGRSDGSAAYMPVFMDQRHSSVIRRVSVRNADVPVDADGLVVEGEVGSVLSVLTADCVPVVVASGRRGRLMDYGVVHAGRVGLLDGIVKNMMTVLLDKEPDIVHVFIGAHICGRCYEVSPEVLAESENILGTVAARSRWGTAAIDLNAGVVSVVKAEAQRRKVAVSFLFLNRDGLFQQGQGEPMCTYESSNFFSYRRFIQRHGIPTRRNGDKNTNVSHESNDGRFATVTWINHCDFKVDD